MRLKGSLLAIFWSAATVLAAQTPVNIQVTPEAPKGALEKAVAGPTESDLYCSGFFTRRIIAPDLMVLGGPDGALKYEYASGDFIYLNRGKNLLKAPGGQYTIVRPVKDLNTYETFKGQRRVIFEMGGYYADIARVQVQVLNEGSATAEITNSCEAVQAGDIAIPFTPRPALSYKKIPFTERFAPASGKATGLIAATKGFGTVTGANEIVYLNLGKKQGLEPGVYLRIFRSYLSQDDDLTMEASKNYPTEMNGIPEGLKLTVQEKESVPRQVLGELMILSSEDGSSTGLITYSLEDIYPGDGVEIE